MLTDVDRQVKVNIRLAFHGTKFKLGLNLALRYRVFRKYCVFFIIHCNTSLAFIAVRDLQSSQRNAGVQSLLLACDFLYNQ